MLTTITPAFWDIQYDNGRIPWDLGRPTPVFQRLLDSGQYPPGRMIVLGAGRGHDARLFARQGFDVTAVDFAPQAVRAMYSLNDQAMPFHIMQQDIFDLSSDLDGTFDYVLEYTCFCAISPQRRTDYADLVRRLLKPGGFYIALAFPIIERAGGPPYAVSPREMISILSTRGLLLHQREQPQDSVPSRKGIEELLIMRKPEMGIPLTAATDNQQKGSGQNTA